MLGKEEKMKYFEKRVQALYNKYGRLPRAFTIYNADSLENGICPTVTANNGGNYGRVGGGVIK